MLSSGGTLGKKDFTDYEFIVQEAERFLNLSTEEIAKYFADHPEDAFYTLPRPNGGDLLFTRSGEERFYQIARRGLGATGPLGRKHHLPEIVKALKFEFMSRLSVSSPVTDENAHDLFSTAAKASASKHISVTHLIPCSIVVHRTPERFRIGPVEFVLRDVFMKEHGPELRGTDLTANARFGFDELQDFFSRFHWVASAMVEACDKTISQRKARKVVQMGLDLVKLFIGSSRASHVRQGYDVGSPAETASLVHSQKGFSISLSRKMHEAVVMDEWYQLVSKSKPWKVAESVIAASLATWEDLSEPYQRFLDALAWHGEAIAEPQAQSRVIKFWIAIERVVSLRRNDKITRRAAMLISRCVADYSDRSKECDRLYGYRSAVMHGAAKRESEYFQTASEVEKLSCHVLCSYLSVLGNLQLNGTVTVDALKSEFERLNSKFEPPRTQGKLSKAK